MSQGVRHAALPAVRHVRQDTLARNASEYPAPARSPSRDCAIDYQICTIAEGKFGQRDLRSPTVWQTRCTPVHSWIRRFDLIFRFHSRTRWLSNRPGHVAYAHALGQLATNNGDPYWRSSFRSSFCWLGFLPKKTSKLLLNQFVSKFTVWCVLMIRKRDSK